MASKGTCDDPIVIEDSVPLTDLQQLVELLRSSQRIVVVSGLGISVNAGFPASRCLERQTSLDFALLSSHEKSARFYYAISGLFTHLKAGSTQPTLFHEFLKTLADLHHLVRNYTINLDCLEQSFPRLEARTVRLHGRVDQLRCTQCGRTFPFQPATSPGAGLPPCPSCLKRSDERVSNGRRKLRIGLLRPNVLLYNEPDPEEDTILHSLQDDVEECPDLVLVVGMTSAPKNVVSLIKNLRDAAQSVSGKTVWASTEEPSSKLKPLFDCVYQGDCDAIARLYGSKPRPQPLTYKQLFEFDDILTDALVDHACYWTTTRKTCKSYQPLNLADNDVVSILREYVILKKDLPGATSQILELPGIKKYTESLRSANAVEHFRRHLRKYLNIYLTDCPFEILSTVRYSGFDEAMVVARKPIARGSEIKYLCGTIVPLHEEELAVLARDGRDFSIMESLRKHTTSAMLGPLRFVNHDCKPNARLDLLPSGARITALEDIQPGQEITVWYDADFFGEGNKECLCDHHWELGCDDIQAQQSRSSHAMRSRKRAAGSISGKPSNPQCGPSGKRVKGAAQSRSTQDRVCGALSSSSGCIPLPRDVRHRRLYGYQWPKTKGSRGENEIPCYDSQSASAPDIATPPRTVHKRSTAETG